jgi:hypothetical protein
MNRRDFLKGLSLVAGGAAIVPASIAEAIAHSSAVNTPDNPWLQHREIEQGYSKLRLEIIRRYQELYRDPQFGWAQIPERFVVSDQRILAEFDVPPSAAVQYELGQPIPSDIWPYISNLWPSEIAINIAEGRSVAAIKAELFDPGDGIDIYAIEKVLVRRT